MVHRAHLHCVDEWINEDSTLLGVCFYHQLLIFTMGRSSLRENSDVISSSSERELNWGGVAVALLKGLGETGMTKLTAGEDVRDVRRTDVRMWMEDVRMTSV